MSLLLRPFKISSSYFLFDAKLENFKMIFICSEYPASFIDKCIRLFLDRIVYPSPTLSTATKQILFFLSRSQENMA